MSGRTTEQERRLHILTVNIRGLKTNGQTLLNELKNEEVDVVFLTETHIGQNATDTKALAMFAKDWKIYHTCSSSSSKGAAILLNKKRDFTCSPEVVDEEGRYVIVNCMISGTLCTFVSVYHHRDEKELFKKLTEKIKPLDTDILVVGGDFNTTLDKEKDKRNAIYDYPHNRIRKELRPFMKEHDLIDAWREKHPDKIQYTYKVGSCEFSRLDYFFINADKWNLVQDCRHKKYISDHRSVSLILDLKNLQILSSTVPDLPGDEDLAKLCPDILLLAKGKAEDKDYIKKLEEVEKEKWIVLWSEHSNAAILVTKGQRDIHILFTVYHTNYVIMHCIVLGRLHTYVSTCHPTKRNLQNMLREKMFNPSRTVIGGDFNTNDQTIMKFKKTNNFNIPEGRAVLPCLIHATLTGASEIKEEILDRSFFLLILHLPKIKTEDADNIILSLNKLKIHH